MAEAVNEPTSVILCKFCKKSASKYTCPRCNKQYCSIDCYRGQLHMQCSEAFYRDCFMGAIQDFGSSNESKQKVADILSRLHDQGQRDDDNTEDGEDVESLHERFAHVDLDCVSSDEILEKLSDKERQEFEQLLQDGTVGTLIEAWQPWWQSGANKKLVEEVTHVAEAAQKKTSYPEIWTKIPSIDTLLQNKDPSEHLQYNILNVLYGYVYLARRFNGDYMETPTEGVDTVLEVSSALRKGTFQSPETAINDCIVKSQNKSNTIVYVSQQFSIAIIEDLCNVLSCGTNDFALAGLSELWRMFCKAMKDIQTSKPMKQELYGVIKKLEFYLAWCKKYGQVLGSSVPSLQLEYCRLGSELAHHEDIKSQFEAKWGGAVPPPPPGKLIEEL